MTTNPDIIARMEAFSRIRRVSGMRRAEVAKATGLTVGSLRIYSAPSSGKAPTWKTIEVLRAEAVKRAKAAVAKAEDALFRAEISLHTLEWMADPAGVDRLFFVYKGIPVYHVYTQQVIPLRYWYSFSPEGPTNGTVCDGEFDIRTLPGWAEGRRHTEVIAEAIDAGVVPSVVEGKSSLETATVAAEGQPKASRGNFPAVPASSRNQISPCPSSSSATVAGQI